MFANQAVLHPALPCFKHGKPAESQMMLEDNDDDKEEKSLTTSEKTRRWEVCYWLRQERNWHSQPVDELLKLIKLAWQTTRIVEMIRCLFSPLSRLPRLCGRRSTKQIHTLFPL